MARRAYLIPVNGRKSFNGKAEVEFYGRFACCISYGTQVAKYDTFSGEFTRQWSGYSQTTMNHINSFRETICGLPAMNKAQWIALPVE